MHKLLVALTGGGTAGHVMPHLALLPEFTNRNWEVFYVGSSGIEKDIITKSVILYSFPQTAVNFNPNHSTCVGSPVRSELFEGKKESGLKICDFTQSKNEKIIMFMGGSQGAARLNDALMGILPDLVKKMNVIHL